MYSFLFFVTPHDISFFKNPFQTPEHLLDAVSHFSGVRINMSAQPVTQTHVSHPPTSPPAHRCFTPSAQICTLCISFHCVLFCFWIIKMQLILTILKKKHMYCLVVWSRRIVIRNFKGFWYVVIRSNNSQIWHLILIKFHQRHPQWASLTTVSNRPRPLNRSATIRIPIFISKFLNPQ